jgi:hypothetical protein
VLAPEGERAEAQESEVGATTSHREKRLLAASQSRSKVDRVL